MRVEEDFLGKKEIEEQHLFGIHSLRARENFDNSTLFPVEWYRAIGLVKLAYYKTYRKFRDTAREKSLPSPGGHMWLPDKIIDALENAAVEVSEGRHFSHFIVPAVQGGAGTSINMNVNEIIANVALLKTGRKPGDYHYIDPLDHANIYQSTNDVIPTALHIALIQLTDRLEKAINATRSAMETLEQTYRNEIRQAYTQMQKAVPSTYGNLFASYSDALSRDWWRTSRIKERLKEVNIGGGAAGTGMGIPRFFILQVTKELRKITGLPLAQSENMVDATMNNDALVESHAILKALAVNLEKISADLRLLAADLFVHSSVKIPQKQMGSSMMPGKVNPVIPEFQISISHKVYANDQMIANLAARGCLDLNAYLPSIGLAFIESFNLLCSGCKSMTENLLKDMKVSAKNEQDDVFKNPSITTALVPYIGHKKAALLARDMKESNTTVFESNGKLAILPEGKILRILQPSSLTAKGFSLKDINPEETGHSD